jgi:hypothetical protein
LPVRGNSRTGYLLGVLEPSVVSQVNCSLLLQVGVADVTMACPAAAR